MKWVGDDRRESSFGGFQYRWNYDEYQKTLQKKRKKNAAAGMRAFCVTTVFVLLLCVSSLVAVLVLAMMRGDAGHAVTDGAIGGDLTLTVPDLNGNAPNAPAPTPSIPNQSDSVNTPETPTWSEEETAEKANTETETETEPATDDEAIVTDAPETDVSETEQTSDTTALEDGDAELVKYPLDARGLGISGVAVTPDEATLYRVPRGIFVQFVEPGSYAERFGLKSGDILLSAMQVTTEVETVSAEIVQISFDTLSAYEAWQGELCIGDVLDCIIFRAGEARTVRMQFAVPEDTAVPEN